ncbi:MAG: hypothetical protein ACK566_05660 [Bacteroidota bacterium]|jgi:hypothetical protein
MTPLEKAKELFGKYWAYTWHNGEKIVGLTKQAAKQCALIAVDEIIQIVPTVYVTDDNEIHSGHRQYWQKVKQEIQKL